VDKRESMRLSSQLGVIKLQVGVNAACIKRLHDESVMNRMATKEVRSSVAGPRTT
jgi:hypothetical protein